MALSKNKIFQIGGMILLALVLCISVGLNLYLLKEGDTISKYHVAVAEKIIGMQFTFKERKQMLSRLQGNLSKYQKLREIHLDNSVPPVLLFNPIVPGQKLPEQNFFSISDFPKIKVLEDLDELAFQPIPVLANLIRNHQITSTQLTMMYLNRLKKYGPKLECIITLTEELALEQARKADKEIAAGNYRSLLHGIPWGAKDLFSTRGIKTTWGAMPYKDQIIDKDATVVKKLEEAGAVLVAKLTLGALAMGDVWFGGKTRNPWDITRGSSGSSAGPAAAVAAGLVPFAIGTETWGSIVSPSTVCGVTGLRPTFGRVSRYGAMALSWSMDKVGPICRNAEDCAIVFNTIYGPDGKDLTVEEVPFAYQSDIDIRKLKIGYLKKDFESNYSFKKTDSLALEKIREMGVQLIPVKLPELPYSLISFILSAEAAAAFDELTRCDKDDLMVRQGEKFWPNTFRSARFIPAVEYINANRFRYLVMKEMNNIFEKVDLYIAPSWKGGNLLLTNLTGNPCVVVPNGFSEKGRPASFCFVGRLFDEGTILAVAKKFQDATDFHLQHPKMEWINKNQ